MPESGISFTDEQWNFLEEQRVRHGEDGTRQTVSRSQTVRECVDLARAVDSAMDDTGIDLEPGRSRQQWVRQAIIDRARRELGESD